MKWSRILVVIWGLVLAVFAIALDFMRGDINIVNLAFGMVAYTYGPLLGILFLALLGRKISIWSMLAGILASLLVTLCFRPDIYQIALNLNLTDVPTLTQLALVNDLGEEKWEMAIHYVWLYPVTCLLTFAGGIIGSRAQTS